MFILSIGAASVLALYAAAVSTHRRSLDRTHAALVAERIMADIQGRYLPGTSAEELAEQIRDPDFGLPEKYGDYSWDAYLFQPAAGETDRRGIGSRDRGDRGDRGDNGVWEPQELFVRLFVRWKQSGHARSESFYTILLPRAGAPPD
jgi:hypothetical protein